jgi:2-polyprenyl-6-methoxyphenol hydroxylase-like FAD-dependent oxidoreductase
MKNPLPVLIVGAGPTGLLLACELARFNIPFRIIDKKAGRTEASNATWVQARTLELLDQLGIVQRFLKVGHPCRCVNLYTEGKPLVTLPLDQIDSAYPFILMLPQSEIEKLLIDYLTELKQSIEWSVELVEMKQAANQVISTIKLADGTLETITSDWLVACDGANSTVREKSGIVFPGEDITEQFVVADATINSFMSTDEIHMFFDEATLFAASPMGKNRYRIAANIHQSHPRKTFYEKEVIEMVQERGHGAYYVTDISWISPFWIHGKIAKQMRYDSIFLAGDAAHIHAPLGGQGMNTGMQDVHNLAWKLALVIAGNAGPALLDSYEVERFPIIEDVVAQTEKFTKMALFDKDFLKKLRAFSLQLQQDTHLVKQMNSLLSQTGIHYLQSPIIKYDEKIDATCPQPGTRAPDTLVQQATHLYDYLRHLQHTVLIFTGHTPDKELTHIKELRRWLQQTYSRIAKIYVVASEKLKQIEDIILDAELSLHSRYQVKGPAIFIIRPDHYIGYYSESLEQAAIEEFFTKYID